MKMPSKSATKAQILEEFEKAAEEYAALQEEKDELEKELEKQRKLAQQAAKAAKETEAQPKEAPKEQNKAKEKTMPEVMNEPKYGGKDKMTFTLSLLEQLQNGFSSTLAELSEKLTIEAQKLQALLKLSKEEREKLVELYDIQAGEESLAQLLEEYEDSTEAFKEEYRSKKEELEAAFMELQSQWLEQEKKHKQAVAERNHTALMSQSREREEYQYHLNLSRKLDEEQYQASAAEHVKQREERREALEKQWQEYEKTLAEKEKEQSEVLAKADKLTEEKEAAIKKAENEGVGIGNKQARIKADLLEREIEGQRRIYEQRLSALQARVDAQQARIQALSEQVSAANKQMQDLAVKAIEGAANSSSLNAFKELAMEQAKAQGKGKS